jgi:hypothetical protein
MSQVAGSKADDESMREEEAYDEDYYARHSLLQHPRLHDLYAVQGGVDSVGAVERRMEALAAAVDSLIERVETAGPCATGLPATKSTLGFFYMEEPSLDRTEFENFHKLESNMDRVEFRQGSFYLNGEFHQGSFYLNGSTRYITNCKICASACARRGVALRKN